MFDCFMLRRQLACIVLLAALAWMKSATAQNIEALEGQLDETIRAACHGYMVDALPESLSWLRDNIYEGSPFCNLVNAAFDKRALSDAVQSAFTKATTAGGDLDLSKKHDRDLNITIECDAEYMCIESRLKYLDTQTPVSQAEYNAVNQYCGERYGCIEAFFREWPRDIPAPKKTTPADNAGSSGLSFAALMSPQPSSPANDGQQISPQIKIVTTQRPTKALLSQNDNIRQKCECSLANRDCYNKRIGYVRSQLASIEALRKEFCLDWQSSFDSLTESSNIEMSDVQAYFTELQTKMRRMDETGVEIDRLGAEDFFRMRAQIQSGRKATLSNIEEVVEGMAREVLAMGAPALPRGRSTAGGSRTVPDQQTAARSSPGLVFGPRLPYSQAMQYCQARGMRLPTLAQARSRIDELQKTEGFYGTWTTEQTSGDRMINKRRTLMNSGFDEGFLASESHKTVCFP